MGGAGAFVANHGGGGMRGSYHGGPNFTGNIRAGHQRPAYGRRDPGGYYDYGYDNSCLNYPPYYRRNPWDCYW